ncbi:hypothetical protein [Asanoa sp. NPDC050611]|uniref:hypothetical protein n=1 Tax=Asanoa sp. NPDC050611 TaxID=3157098 RepID=UPI0033E05B15
MAGLSIVVCLAPDSSADLVTAIDTAMAPFEAAQGFAPERDQWFRWSVEGGSDGHGFRILPGQEDDPRLVHDQAHRRDGPRPSLPGMCAGGPRGLLDLAGPRAEAAAAAAQVWDLFHRLPAELPAALPLEHFVALPENQLPRPPVVVGADGIPFAPDPGRRRAERQYRAQPLLRHLHDALFFTAGAVGQWPEILPWFSLDREQYVARRVEETRRPSELLTLDGWWVELGYPPVHGSCESLDDCPHRAGRTQPWTRADMAAYLEGLSEDIIIVRLRGRV